MPRPSVTFSPAAAARRAISSSQMLQLHWSQRMWQPIFSKARDGPPLHSPRAQPRKNSRRLSISLNGLGEILRMDSFFSGTGLRTVGAFQAFVDAPNQNSPYDGGGKQEETALSNGKGGMRQGRSTGALAHHAVGFSFFENLGFFAGGDFQRLRAGGY